MKRFWNFINEHLSTLFIVLLFCAAVLFVSMYAQNFKDWTGFSGDKTSDDGIIIPVKIYQSSKTLWDWLQLLLVPLILAIVAYLLNESQQKRQRETEQNKQNQSTLDSYFDRMTELLLKEKLKESPVDSEARALARTLSLTALRNLDGKRKGQVIQFLYESKLIFTGKGKTIVYLEMADLTEADLSGLHLENVHLNTCNLRKANFKGAWLKGANLNMSKLQEADLSDVPLDYGSLDMAILIGANLEGAMLWGTSCAGTHFENANLKKTMLGNPGVFLMGLGETLTDEKKHSLDAVFSSDNGNFPAIFANADLTGAKVGNYQLKFVCLNNTIMPDGTRYKEWLKNQETEFQEARKPIDLDWQQKYDDFERKRRFSWIRKLKQ